MIDAFGTPKDKDKELNLIAIDSEANSGEESPEMGEEMRMHIAESPTVQNFNQIEFTLKKKKGKKKFKRRKTLKRGPSIKLKEVQELPNVHC